MIYLMISNMVYAVLLFFALVKGIEIGMRIKKEEKPVKTIKEVFKEKSEKKELEENQKKLNTIISNIESYDGTAKNQKDI